MQHKILRHKLKDKKNILMKKIKDKHASGRQLMMSAQYWVKGKLKAGQNKV